jgi:hypothetical protein
MLAASDKDNFVQTGIAVFSGQLSAKLSPYSADAHYTDFHLASPGRVFAKKIYVKVATCPYIAVDIMVVN